MHKFSSSDSFPKLRPVFSSRGTFNHNLARFFYDLLSPLVTNDYSCKDTFSFVSQIKNANLSKKCFVSDDVTSLFTNIPLQETTDIAINPIFNLMDSSFKICNNWNSFHNDIENIKSNLIKNAYPPFLIDKIIKRYLDYKSASNQNQLKDKSATFHTISKINFRNLQRVL